MDIISIKTMFNMGAFRRERPASWPLDDGAKSKIYQVKLNNTIGFVFGRTFFFLRMRRNRVSETSQKFYRDHSARFGPFFCGAA